MSKDSAIQSDVQTEQDTSKPGNTDQPDKNDTPAPKSPREEAMEAIEARHHTQTAAENGYTLAEQAEKDKAAEAEQQLAAQLAEEEEDKKPDAVAPATVTTESAATIPASVRIKVNGQEQDVPIDEVIRQYQKHNSADQRLAEATRLLREAQEREAQYLLYQQQQAALAATTAAPQGAATPNPPDPVTTESGKEFLKALFEGDEEHALNALNKVMQGRPTQPVAAAPILDVHQIAENVAQQVRHQMTVDSVLERNRTDYPELYADPDIEQLAASKIHALRQTGMDFPTALNTVSEDFAKKFRWGEQREPEGRPAEKPAPTTSPTRAAKLENKQRVDNVASLTTKTVTHDDAPEDTSAVIAQMRAARGGI